MRKIKIFIIILTFITLSACGYKTNIKRVDAYVSEMDYRPEKFEVKNGKDKLIDKEKFSIVVVYEDLDLKINVQKNTFEDIEIGDIFEVSLITTTKKNGKTVKRYLDY